jgi:hypothetical protein
MRIGRLLPAGFVALAVVAASAQASQAVAVTLRAGSSTAALNASVTLTATARGLAAGDRVRIVGRGDSSGGATTVRTCAKAVCVGRFADQLGETMIFQAQVLRHGKPVAHSSSVSVTWQDTTPPAPPPAPSAPAGHYCGLTNEGKSICFDVTAAPQAVMTNMKTESVANCGDGSSWVWTLSFSQPVSILQPGLTASYQYTGSLPDFQDTTHVQVAYTVNATFDTAGNASGTINLTHVSWDSGGTHYDCAGDPRTWTGRLGA